MEYLVVSLGVVGIVCFFLSLVLGWKAYFLIKQMEEASEIGLIQMAKEFDRLNPYLERLRDAVEKNHAVMLKYLKDLDSRYSVLAERSADMAEGVLRISKVLEPIPLSKEQLEDYNEKLQRFQDKARAVGVNSYEDLF